MDRNLKLLDKEKPHGFANYYVIHGTENVNTVGVNKSVWQKKKMTHENLSSLKSEYIAKIEAIPTVSFNKEQKEIAKRIIQNTDEKDLHSVFGLITQRVKTGFVFDEAPEVNHNAVALVKEWQELNIGDEASCFVDENTEHTLIIGENYDALKNLCATYIDKSGKGLVDVIYIDPPYNTEACKNDGNDYKEQVESNKFIYRDKFTRDGWLNMMNERLKLARRLLSDKGVIFISIDDSEQAYLKVLCDEIFGEENFVNCFIWKRNSSGKTEIEKFTINTEYVLFYRKSSLCELNSVYKPLAEATKKLYNKNDNDGRGFYRLYPLQKPAAPGPETTYDYIDNGGKTWKCPEKGWRMKYEKLKALENDNRLVFTNATLSEKAYWNERENEGKRVDTLWDDLPENTAATSELKSIFNEVIFNNPKPIKLIQRCINIHPNPKTILDFFAGSGTTGQAVMELNAEDGGKRKAILVTNNENSIGEKITRERLYRVINGKGSKDESISWKYSENQPCLNNNSVRVFKIENHQLTLNDLQKAEELKESAKIEFKKLNPNFDTSNDFDIYNELASLNPYKE